MEFKNKVVLVTGASSGIGAATAELFAELSAQVVLVGRNEENLKKVGKICEGFNGIKPLVIVADVSKDADLERIIAKTIETFNKIDVLVNNAGIGVPALIADGIQSYDLTFATNTRPVYYLTSLAIPYLAKTKGNIINVSSIAAVKPIKTGLCSYSMSKVALDMFTKCAALELAPQGIRVNSVNPGTTKTDIFRRSYGLTKEDEETYFKKHGQTVPLKKLAVSKDIAEMIVFYAGERANSITGATIVIDNGETLAVVN